MELSTYLFFNGQCADAFKFYEKCLEGKLETIKYAGSPGEADLPAEWRDKIMHARLTIGESTDGFRRTASTLPATTRLLSLC